MDKIVKDTEINFKVGLDENNVPVEMKWNATDGGGEGKCKALMLAIWDENEQNTMRIDLWNKEMTVDEMKQFFHQTLLTMSDTFERATGEAKISGDMKDFAAYFAEKMDLIKKD